MCGHELGSSAKMRVMICGSPVMVLPSCLSRVLKVNRVVKPIQGSVVTPVNPCLPFGFSVKEHFPIPKHMDS